MAVSCSHASPGLPGDLFRAFGAIFWGDHACPSARPLASDVRQWLDPARTHPQDCLAICSVLLGQFFGVTTRVHPLGHGPQLSANGWILPAHGPRTPWRPVRALGAHFWGDHACPSARPLASVVRQWLDPARTHPRTAWRSVLCFRSGCFGVTTPVHPLGHWPGFPATG